MNFERVKIDEYIKEDGDFYLPYDEIKIPKRATRCSAGYDIYSPVDFILHPGDTIKLPTFIKVNLDDDKFLMIAPRSGQGFKYKVQLYNTVGVIDADYYSNKSNDGHIWVKLYNDSPEGKPLEIKRGEAICQGIILKYYTVEGDESEMERVGGFGSTN